MPRGWRVGRRGSDALNRQERAVLLTGAAWAVVAGLALLFSSPPEGASGDMLRTIGGLLACLLPLALGALGIVAWRAGERATEAAETMADAAAALHQLVLSERQGRSARVTTPAADRLRAQPSVSRSEPGLVADRVPDSDPAPAGTPAPPRPAPSVPFSTRRVQTGPAPSPRPAGPEPQLDLAGLAPAEDAAMEDVIVALNFPETPDDRAGFAALRRALKDTRAQALIRQAQDVLTLLSQDGIYTDDLIPDRARPELWRRFANGERGRMVGALGGIRDRDALATAAARMREDAIFRDAAHHFLRSFDRTFAALEPDATDEDVARLTDTRSARAFMLLGRAAGMFDH